MRYFSTFQIFRAVIEFLVPDVGSHFFFNSVPPRRCCTVIQKIFKLCGVVFFNKTFIFVYRSLDLANGRSDQSPDPKDRNINLPKLLSRARPLTTLLGMHSSHSNKLLNKYM